MKRSATFTEANAWVHLSPEWFPRHFPSLRSVWQTEDGRVWVDVTEPLGVEQPALALWELAERRTGEAVLPCGCRIQVRYRPHARETLCTFFNKVTGFVTTLQISPRLMLIASAPAWMHEALCVHPHDEATVREQLEQALAEARAHRRTS
jgi:hypothetical protein